MSDILPERAARISEYAKLCANNVNNSLPPDFDETGRLAALRQELGLEHDDILTQAATIATNPI